MSVGVILPVHAPSPWLEEALAAVLGQEPPPDEVVVVDDGSPEPVALPARFRDRCRLVRRPERVGPASARDEGLAELGAELVALADSDDAWEPGKLAAQLDALARHPGIAVCFGRAIVVGPDGSPTGEDWEEPPAGPLDPERLLTLLFERNPIPGSSALIRRDSLEAAGGFSGPGPPAPLASDWDLWLRLAAGGATFVSEPRAVIRYRRHAGGVSGDVAALAEASLAIHEAHAGLVDERTRQRARAADLEALARGRVRQRRYREARALLVEAASLETPSPRARLLRALLAVPGLRAALGRRDPFR
jgi:glycosyltransferase involved in cell wall biosynthesis